MFASSRRVTVRWPVIFLMACILMAGCSDDDAVEQAVAPVEDPVEPISDFSFPVAEWQQAKAVLVHEPGEEVAHSERTGYLFDVPVMQQEWTQFMDVLRRNGIRIFKLTDVLAMIPVQQLRETAREMFSHDFSYMGKADLIRYMIETPPLDALFYTRDQSITTPRGTILCKMKFPARKLEPEIVALCYQYLGGSVFYRIGGSSSRMEGGDYLPFGTLSLIGEGERTNREAIRELMAADAFGHDTLVVVKDKVKNMYQMHLDTYFNIIDRNLAVMSQKKLEAQRGDAHFLAADVYVRAAGETSYRLEGIDVSFVDLLRQRGVSIIPIQESDETMLACNFLCIGPRHIVARKGLSENFIHSMQENGVTVEWVKLDEVVKGYGAAHCMTQVIGRE